MVVLVGCVFYFAERPKLSDSRANAPIANPDAIQLFAAAHG